jgi:hypothetical protein
MDAVSGIFYQGKKYGHGVYRVKGALDYEGEFKMMSSMGKASCTPLPKTRSTLVTSSLERNIEEAFSPRHPEQSTKASSSTTKKLERVSSLLRIRPIRGPSSRDTSGATASSPMETEIHSWGSS